MNTKYVIVLACIAAILAGTTVLTRQAAPGRIADDRRGVAVFPDMLKRANDVAQITVQNEEAKFVVVRTSDGFIEQSSGYPVKPEIFRDLVAAAATLSFEEAKTRDPSRFGDLGLEHPTAAADAKKTDDEPEVVSRFGREVAYLDSAGQTIAQLIVGNRESNVGGARGGQYIRLPNEERAWLVRGAANVPEPHTAWFEINLINLDRRALARVDMGGGGLEEVAFESADEKSDLKLLTPIPEGRQENTTNILRVAFMMDPISFENVRKPQEEIQPGARQIVATGRNGLRITITNVGAIDDGWVRISAEATADEAKEQLETLKPKIEGFEFRLIDRYAEVLRWGLENVTEEIKS